MNSDMNTDSLRFQCARKDCIFINLKFATLSKIALEAVKIYGTVNVRVKITSLFQFMLHTNILGSITLWKNRSE